MQKHLKSSLSENKTIIFASNSKRVKKQKRECKRNSNEFKSTRKSAKREQKGIRMDSKELFRRKRKTA